MVFFIYKQMIPKEKILELIEKEKLRIEKEKSYFFKRFFMTRIDKRWYDGRIYMLEELECMIEDL